MDELRAKMLPVQHDSLYGKFLQVLSLLRSFWAWLVSLLMPIRIIKVGQHRVRLVERIAEGGFGYVWVAEDLATRRRFAAKEVLCQSDEQRTQLRREIEAHDLFSADRRHDNLMPLIDYGFDKVSTGERGWLLFPLMGRSLQDVINQHSSPEVRSSAPVLFSELACLQIARGLARGLAAMHTAGKVHRDVCPRNILLSEARDGPGSGGVRTDFPTAGPRFPTVVLSDFGSLAPVRVSIGTRADAARLADEASMHSSPPYRAPELWSCDPGAEIGPPGDVFSAGATIFCCAFGLSPFESVRNENTGQLRIVEPSHVRTLNGLAFPSGHGFSKAFCDLLLAMCEQDPTHRPTLQQVLATVDRMLQQQGVVLGDGRGLDDSV